MAKEALGSGSHDISGILSSLELVVGQFADGMAARLAVLGQVHQEVTALNAAFAAAGTSAAEIAFQIIIVVFVTVGVFLLSKRFTGGWRPVFETLIAAGLALASGFIVLSLLPVQGLSTSTLRVWVVVITAALVVTRALWRLLTRTPPPGKGRRGRLARSLCLAVWWAMLGLALATSLRRWGAGAGLLELLDTLAIAMPTFLLLTWSVWRHRKTLAGAIVGTKPRHRWRGRFARVWPGFVVGFLLVTFLTTEVAATLDVPLSGVTVLSSIVIVFLTPLLDVRIANWASRAMEGEHVSIVGVALRRTMRFALFILMMSLLGTVWASPLAVGFGINLHGITVEVTHIALISLAGAVLWNMLSVGMALITHNDKRKQQSGAPGYSRLGTLVPLIGRVGKCTIAALVFLSALVTMGVNVWPLITGFSIFGLAVGFGSQALVKDIVAGVFFLIDDAFRLGEYIETSGAKGTVERISVRSVTLRNPRGPVSTVPYGQISKIQNFSRDYSVVKIQFRLAIDTDVEMVRKLFKKIGLELVDDPELAPGVIEPFRSQGVSNIEDGTLMVIGKFVARPGYESLIRRQVMKAVHRGFLDNGVRAVPKPLTGGVPNA